MKGETIDRQLKSLDNGIIKDTSSNMVSAEVDDGRRR